MKRVILASVLGLVGSAMANPFLGDGLWAQTGTGTTLASVMEQSPGLVTVLSYVNATSDKAGSVLQFYTAGAAINPTSSAAAAQKDVVVPDGTAFSGGNIVVLYDVATDTCQRAVVDSVSTNTVTFLANLAFVLGTGDEMYIMTAGATIKVGAATKELNAAPGLVYASRRGRPLLIDLDGTSACSINAATGILWTGR